MPHIQCHKAHIHVAGIVFTVHELLLGAEKGKGLDWPRQQYSDHRLQKVVMVSRTIHTYIDIR